VEAEVEEAVHGEDGMRRVWEEASDSGKEGRSRERKWCDGGRSAAVALSASRERGSEEERD